MENSENLDANELIEVPYSNIQIDIIPAAKI